MSLFLRIHQANHRITCEKILIDLKTICYFLFFILALEIHLLVHHFKDHQIIIENQQIHVILNQLELVIKFHYSFIAVLLSISLLKWLFFALIY